MFAPFGTYTKAMRRGAPVAAAAATAGCIASSIGNAIAVPRPLRNVLRGICQFFMCVIVLGGLCVQEAIIAVSSRENKVPMGEFVNRDAAARERDLRNRRRWHKKFAFLHAEPATD